jgi:hypothetical protein
MLLLPVCDPQLFFLTIARKNKTKMASVIEDDKISPTGGSSKMPKLSSKDSRISWIAKRENAMAANIIFLRPVLLYAKIDNANKRREKIPVAARITLSILSYHSSSNNSV